jgi:hypothetical protein
MKLVSFFLLIFIKLHAQISTIEKNITNGTWLLFKVEDKWLGDSNLREITFNHDKTFNSKLIQESEISKGAYEISSDGKEFIIKGEDNNNIIYVILVINSNKISLSREGNITELKKISPNYTLPKKEFNNKLIGCWQIKSRNNISLDVEELIKFDADGSSIVNFASNEAKWWTRANLIYINSGNEEVFEYTFSKKNNVLSFTSGKDKMTLMKTKKEPKPLSD